MALAYFVPIFAFLLIFIVVYALLKKTGVLGGNEPIMLLVSFIFAIFFIMEASLVEVVKFSSGWFSVVLIIIFFIVLLIGFLPGKEPLKFLEKNWISWVILGVIIGVFVLSSIYVFNWVINWKLIASWLGAEWLGTILLLVIAIIVAVVFMRKK
ncbi:MAG: hypothetical protein Q8N88_01755 [Nanoarchaeota archaeon]|nr:hypothetical protein [Nanoarchaeota archaeon]